MCEGMYDLFYINGSLESADVLVAKSVQYESV